MRVSAPIGMSKARINAFIEAHRTWIEASLAKMSKVADAENDFYSRLNLDGGLAPDGVSHVSARKARAEAVSRLSEIVNPMVEHYSALMGVRPTSITYRATKSRWGSCMKTTGRISLSLYLLLLPEWCIEHVVVHEMAHLIVPNHSPEFYAVMDRFFPRWKEARTYTRRMVRGQIRESQ